MSAAAFAEMEGANARSLQNWAWKLTREAESRGHSRGRRSTKGGSTTGVRFVEVGSAAREPMRLEVAVAGAVVRVPKDVDTELLARIVRALKAAA